MTDAPPKLKDRFSYSHKVTTLDYERTKSSLDYMIKRRDEHAGKIDFGFITLNGASFVALITALGSAGAASNWLHLSATQTAFSAVAFAVGVAAAGYCALSTSLTYNSEASKASTRTLLLERQLGLLDEIDTDERRMQYKETLEDPALPMPIGFDYSKTAIILRSLAAGLWLYGASNILEPIIVEQPARISAPIERRLVVAPTPTPTPLPGKPSVLRLPPPNRTP